MDPEHKLKKKLKNSSKKLKTQAKNSKSRHFLKRCLPEMRPKRKPVLKTHQHDIERIVVLNIHLTLAHLLEGPTFLSEMLVIY